MKLKVLIVLLLASVTTKADLTSVSLTERGFFSVSLPASYSETRVMNSDGSFASYKGYLGGLGIDVQLWGSEGGSELRVFGSYLIGEAKGSGDEDKLRRDETFFGFKVYPNPSVFLAAGMGRSSSQLSRLNASDVTLTSTISGFGGGFETHIGGSWFVSVGAWYKSGPIKQKENTSLNHNSFVDGAELQLQLVWSPPSTTMNFTGKSRGARY